MSFFNFKKEERLKSKIIIDALFKQGESAFVYPIKLIWKKEDDMTFDAPVKVGFAVPKRVFPKAVQRNFLKRKMREAYRLNKHVFYAKAKECQEQYAMMFIYVAREPLSYKNIEKAIVSVLAQIR